MKAKKSSVPPTQNQNHFSKKAIKQNNNSKYSICSSPFAVSSRENLTDLKSDAGFSFQQHEISSGKRHKKTTAEFPQRTTLLMKLSTGKEFSLWPATLAKPLWHAVLHNELSFHTDQQLLHMAVSASGLDASQWTGRESLPREVPFQCQGKHEGYQFKRRGELEQEFHGME